MSANQLKILRTYCRKHRLTKWGIVPMVALACFLLYAAIFIIPNKCIMLHSELTPTRVVIIDSTTNTKEEIAPDPETEKFHFKLMMMFGATAGWAGAMGIFILAQAIFQPWCNWHRKAFFDFLKATDKGNLNNTST